MKKVREETEGWMRRGGGEIFLHLWSFPRAISCVTSMQVVWECVVIDFPCMKNIPLGRGQRVALDFGGRRRLRYWRRRRLPIPLPACVDQRCDEKNTSIYILLHWLTQMRYTQLDFLNFPTYELWENASNQCDGGDGICWMLCLCLWSLPVGVVTEPKLLKSHPALWMPMINTADLVAVRKCIHVIIFLCALMHIWIVLRLSSQLLSIQMCNVWYWVSVFSLS
jgi:hypothetical protein